MCSMPNESIVFDASSLILLAKVDLLGDIAALWSLVVTDTVAMEATRRKELADAQWIAAAITSGEITVEQVPVDREVRRLAGDFGIARGEASSQALARRSERLLATDDARAIKACRVLRLPFATAIHFLTDAYARNSLSRSVALAKLDRFGQIGWYHPEILQAARRRLEGGN